MVKCELQEPVGQSEEELAAARQSEEELAAAEQSERELAQLEEEETKRILQAKTLELGQTEEDLELELRGAPEEMLSDAEDEVDDEEDDIPPTQEDIPPTQEDIPPTQPEPVTPVKALPAEVQEELLTAAASVRPETMDSEDLRKLQLSMRAQEREKKEAEKAAKDAEKAKKGGKEAKPKGRPRKKDAEAAAAAEEPLVLPTKRLKRKTTLEHPEDHGEEQKPKQKKKEEEKGQETEEEQKKLEMKKARAKTPKEDPAKKKKGQETEEEQKKSETKKATAKTKRAPKEDPAKKKKKGQETEEEQEKPEKKKAPAKTKRAPKEDSAKKKKGQETEEEQEKSDSKKKASPAKKAEKPEEKKKKSKATAEEVAATPAESAEAPVVPAAKRLRRAAGGGDLAAADPQLKAEMIGVIKNFDNKEYDRKGETMHHGKYGNDVQVVVYWTRSSVGVKLCLNGGWAQRYYYSFKDATIALNIFIAAKMCAKLQEKGVEWHCTADATEYDKMLRATATAALQCPRD